MAAHYKAGKVEDLETIEILEYQDRNRAVMFD
jgi:hypothetical protein